MHNKEKHKIYKLKRCDEYRAKVAIISEKSGCKLCGEKNNIVLDFHHYDASTKKFGIGDAVVKLLSWSRIIEEIKKCIVLCANCHRRVHAGQLVVTEDMICIP